MRLAHGTRNPGTPQARQILIPRVVVPRRQREDGGSYSVRHLSGLTMGTSWSVKLVVRNDHPLRELELGIQEQLDRIVAQMSTWLGSSSISCYNRAPAGSWHAVEPEFFTVLTAALDLARSTDGAFDPTVGGIVNLWGFGPQAFDGKRPASELIEASRCQSSWKKVAIDSVGRRVLQPGGVQLDLSSIAKGFGVDQVATYLECEGVSDFLVEVGGELRGAGSKPDGLPWWVMLEVPDETATSRRPVSEALLALHGLSVATSGDYRRRITIGDQVFSHALNPLTGIPVSGPLASVSVVAPQCMMSDALATALFVLGPEAGKDYAEHHRIAARFLLRTDAGLHQMMTRAMVAMLV